MNINESDILSCQKEVGTDQNESKTANKSSTILYLDKILYFNAVHNIKIYSHNNLVDIESQYFNVKKRPKM